jgi:hypothetical protein
MADQDLARAWLRENGYADIADLIDALLAKWKAEGKRTRRNWWETLAGGKNGQPRTIGGKAFPVLKAAQIHQGVPITPNAVCRSTEKSPPPPPRLTKRWPKRRKKSPNSTARMTGSIRRSA